MNFWCIQTLRRLLDTVISGYASNGRIMYYTPQTSPPIDDAPENNTEDVEIMCSLCVDHNVFVCRNTRSCRVACAFPELFPRFLVDVFQFHGIPVTYYGDHTIRQIAMWASYVLSDQFWEEVPNTFPVGYRSYTADPTPSYPLTPPVEVPWWRWNPTFRAVCPIDRMRKQPLHRAPCEDKICMCGFHIAPTPYDALLYGNYRNRILVVAPYPPARVVVHERGWRTERYEVLAAVVGNASQYRNHIKDQAILDMIVEARNGVAKAVEIARILRAFEIQEGGE